MSLFRKRTPEANTMSLIQSWSMDGASADLDGRFGSSRDNYALASEHDDEPASEAAPPAQAPLMMKPAGEDGWRPLLTDVSNAA